MTASSRSRQPATEDKSLKPAEDKAVDAPTATPSVDHTEPVKEYDEAELALTVPEGHVRVRFAHFLDKADPSEDPYVPGEVAVLSRLEAQQVVDGSFGHVVTGD